MAVETLKRYPWTPPGKAAKQLPEYIYSGAWKIDQEGKITIPPIDDWANGDLAQRAAYVLGVADRLLSLFWRPVGHRHRECRPTTCSTTA